MARLNAPTRKALPKAAFAGPDRTFPINDATHARVAISGATRSMRAGHISPATASAIKSRARKKLKG